MALERNLVLNPPVHLEDRDSDMPLSGEQLARISLFSKVKRKPKFEETPGAIRLRRIHRGEVLFRQGEAGWTAMYILTAADLAILGPEFLTKDSKQNSIIQGILKDRALRPSDPETVVSVQIALPSRAKKRLSKGLLSRVSDWILGKKSAALTARPTYIPIDAPRDADLESRVAYIMEGELLGEMSCKTGMPRSGTIIAENDGFLLEMLRSILDVIEKDPGYREEADKTYKRRVMENQLRRLSIFADLTEDQMGRVKDRVELVSFKVGEVICHENDLSDSMYVIRSGLVQAAKNETDLIAVEDVLDWSLAIFAFRDPVKDTGVESDPNGQETKQGPYGILCQSLMATLEGISDPALLTGNAKQEWAYVLNGFIKVPFSDPVKLTLFPMPLNTALKEHLAGLHKDPKQWSDRDKTSLGRRWVEAILPGLLRPIGQKAGLGYILSYLSKGETVGEMGVLSGMPRSATCIAYVHGDPDSAHQLRAAKWRRDESLVELVKIPKFLFEEIISDSPVACLKIIEEVTLRAQRDMVVKPLAALQSGNAQFSEHAEQLGLMQGQRLMLIDLDKCTRCDECVRACVETHDDGRSRLFLDGPRFGNHLVPATCRSCMDPVCMIGCPVGSIHRGNNQQMVIEDWCIGCGLCANNCPYGSIQMHDQGIIPEGLSDWNWVSKPEPGKETTEILRTPLVNGLEFSSMKAGPISLIPHTGPITLKRQFEVDASVLSQASLFRVSLTCPNAPSAVWINGKPLLTDPNWGYKQGRREYVLKKSDKILVSGINQIVATVEGTGKDREVLFDLRMDVVYEAELPQGLKAGEGETLDVSEKLIRQIAVVCDLCSGQWGHHPACVNACPHDAAIRILARTDLPMV